VVCEEESIAGVLTKLVAYVFQGRNQKVKAQSTNHPSDEGVMHAARIWMDRLLAFISSVCSIGLEQLLSDGNTCRFMHQWRSNLPYDPTLLDEYSYPN
jgi:hypothetical protein